MKASSPNQQKSFTDIFINKPILAISLCLLLVLCGIIALFRLPIRQFPRIDSSVITITTTYPGASGALMANFVTTPIENVIANVDGVDYINSSSKFGQSTITVNLKIGTNIDAALTEINTEISAIRWKLPRNVNNPMVQKVDPNAKPVYYLMFNSNSLSTIDMGNFLTTKIKPLLSTVSGVGKIQVLGANEHAMRIWLNPLEMAAHKVTATDVSQAIINNNVQSTAGQIKTQYQQYPVYADTDLRDAKSFNHLIVRQNNGHVIRIQDIGHAQLGAKDDTSSVFMDNETASGIAVLPTSTANPLVVAKAIHAILPSIENLLPKAMHLVLQYDMSQFISASLKEVLETLIEAIIIVVFVVFLILGSLRSIFVHIITIPLSIIIACVPLLLLGYSINTLTLLAAVLAIGLVVDDAIVVTENIHRHVNCGLTPKKAAIIGTREIRFAVIAMTLTLASAYLPIAFTSGLTGILFSEFALTLTCTVIVSGIIALILSPMMCAKLMGTQTSTTKFEHYVDDTCVKVANGYKKILTLLIKWRWLVLIVALLIYLSGALLFFSLPTALQPPEDQGYLFAIMQTPAGANLSYTEKHSQKIADIMQKTPEVVHNIIINGFPYGVNSALGVAILKPWNERKTTANQLFIHWFPKFLSVPGITAHPFNPAVLPGTSAFTSVEFILKTTADYNYLNKYSQAFVKQLKKWGGLRNVDTDLKVDQPQLNVYINRDLATTLGIPTTTIANTLSVLLGQPETTRFSSPDENQNYQVIPELLPQFSNIPDAINHLYLRTLSQQLVPLAHIVDIKKTVGLREINHFQQLHSATITGIIPPLSPITLGIADKELNHIAKSILPANIQTDTADQLRQFIEASGKMTEVFLFAVIFIYLILVAQFESFIDPLIVMLSVPLSLTGALLLLKLVGAELDIYTQIGLVTLLGLMSKQAILIVEFANQLQNQGYTFTEAIVHGASQRLRPIIMTSAAMVLGALPLLRIHGAGGISRFELGLTIVSGLAIGTCFTIFIIPVMYHFLAKKKKPLGE